MSTGTWPQSEVRRGVGRSAASDRRAFNLSYAWIVLGLAVIAILSRLYTTNSLAGEPTSDEYLYAVHARDLARAWAAGHGLSLASLSVEGRSVAFESAVLSFLIPWDALTIGRTVQALLNALCVPMTFVLGRQVGLRRSAAVVAAILLMAVPQFQEIAWRFWTDSQATLLGLIYLSALVTFMRRPGWSSAVIAVLSLAGLVLTKESAAVAFAPFLALGVAIPLSRRVTRSGGRALAVVVGVVLLAVLGLLLLVAIAPRELAGNPLLQRTFGAGPLILNSILGAIPRIPSYSDQLVQLVGMRELGSGVLCATLVGFAWMVTQAVVALVTVRPFPLPGFWPVGWSVAALVWVVGMSIPARALAALQQSDPWILVAAISLLAAIGTVAHRMRNARPNGWGLALLGLVVAAVIAERLIIVATPNVSAAALTFRSLMPIVPLYAIVAAGGIWAASGAFALLTPSVRSARAALCIAGGLALILFWSPLLRERLTNQPLLGRVADRGADPDTPQGLRVEAMVEAEGWLKANVLPNDITITGPGVLRHVAWYADLGVEGLESLVDLNVRPTEEERRQYALERMGPRGAAYMIDFNVNWTDPGGESARHWRQTFEILASKPNLEVAYLRRDKFGHPVFYVMRNHGYASVGQR